MIYNFPYIVNPYGILNTAVAYPYINDIPQGYTPAYSRPILIKKSHKIERSLEVRMLTRRNKRISRRQKK